jgi:hemoglobin
VPDRPPAAPDPRERHDVETVEDVEVLVRRFYQAVVPDPVLGPIFHDVGVDWGVHIPKLVQFWAGRLLGVPGFDGNVAGAHLAVFARCPFGDREMTRWLELWHETLDDLFVGPTAEVAKARAAGAAEAITALVRRRRRAGEPLPAGIGLGTRGEASA